MTGWLDPAGERFFGLGSLGPEQLRAIFPSRVPVTVEMLMAGARAWAAFRQPEPLALSSIVKDSGLALPFMAAAMRRYADDRALLGRHGAAARTRAVAEFSLAGMMARYQKLYDQLLSAPRLSHSTTTKQG